MEFLRLYDVGSFDSSKWRWEDLYNPYNFEWKYGVTPFSNFHVVVGGILVYLLTVFCLRSWMEGKAPFAMKRATQVHNVILCLWSLAMFLGIAYGSFKKASTDGVYSLLCDTNFGGMRGTYWYWSYMFYLSKYYELVDTAILVLKKKPLSVLHVWHHSIMLAVSWGLIAGAVPVHWWGIFANTLVHVFMYYYFYVATLNQHPWWKKYLTTAQIVQFFTVFFVVTAWLITNNYRNGVCAGNLHVVWFTQIVNLSFLALFINFYMQTYSAKRK